MDWKHQGWVSESDLLSWTLRCNLEEWWSVWAIQEIKSKGFDNEFEFVVVQSLNPVWLLQPHLQHARAPCPSPAPRARPNSCPFSRWCHPTISSTVVPFSCPQSFPASGSFPVSQFFTSGGQSIGASALASFLPKNIQCYFPLGLIGLAALLPKGLSKVFSSTTFQKHLLFWRSDFSSTNLGKYSRMRFWFKKKRKKILVGSKGIWLQTGCCQTLIIMKYVYQWSSPFDQSCMINRVLPLCILFPELNEF